MSDVVDVGLHPSLGFGASMENLAESLRLRCLPASFLYRGAGSAALWERLHLAHAPSAQAGARISPHQEALQYLIDKAALSFHLISLGCGLAEKEMMLMDFDEACVQRVDLFDGSLELVAEAMRRWLSKNKQSIVRGLGVDLAAARDWGRLVSDSHGAARVFTLFGMVPNFEMGELLSRLSGVVQSGDYLVLDANLRPPSQSGEGDIPRSIVSQYDNVECRDWLMASLAELGVYAVDGDLSFEVEAASVKSEAPRIEGKFLLDRALEIRLPGQSVSLRRGEPLRVFYSYRYQAEDLPRILGGGGFRLDGAWFSESGEDGVYVFQRN